MDKRSNHIAFAILGMLVLILDSKTAVSGGNDGIQICIRSVIPSLFPFLVLSILLTGTTYSGNSWVLTRFCRLFHIPAKASSLPISAFLGGYPVGAQSIASFYKNGVLEKQEAEMLLAFCNNCGPAFLFGITASSFEETWIPWAMWAIHILSAFCISRWFPYKTSKRNESISSKVSVTTAVSRATQVMAQICGWVILFRVIIAFTQRWVINSLLPAANVILFGFLELTNGCLEASKIDNSNIRFLICSAMLAFGGICVFMQVKAVTDGLSLKYYCFGKISQAIISVLLSWCLLYRTMWEFLLLFLILCYLPKIFQKRVEFRKKMMYNAGTCFWGN